VAAYYKYMPQQWKKKPLFLNKSLIGESVLENLFIYYLLFGFGVCVAKVEAAYLDILCGPEFNEFKFE